MMANNNPNEMDYIPLEGSTPSQPFASISSSLLGPNRAIIDQLPSTWSPSNANWGAAHLSSAFQNFFQNGTSASQFPTEQDLFGEDLYSDSATPKSLRTPENGQDSNINPISERLSALQRQPEDVAGTTSSNQPDIQHGPSLQPNTISGINSPDSAEKSTSKRRGADTHAASERAAELKRQLMAKKRSVGSSTPSKDKGNAKNPERPRSDNTEATTSSAPAEVVATSEPKLNRSAIISAKLKEVKMSGHLNGNGSVSDKPPVPDKGDSASINAPAKAHQRSFPTLSRKDSSQAIDDLLAEGKAAADAAQSKIESNQSTGENLPARKTTPQPSQSLSKTAQLSAPVSSATSEQGEIREEPSPLPKLSDKQPLTAAVKENGKENGKPSTGRGQKLETRREFKGNNGDDNFTSAEEVSKHNKQTTHRNSQAGKTNPRSDGRRDNGGGRRDSYPDTSSGRPREAFRPEPLHRLQEARRLSYDRNQGNLVSRSDHDSQRKTVRRDSIPDLPGKSGTDTASAGGATSNGRPEILTQRMKDFLEIHGFYKFDEATIDKKIARAKRLLEMEEEKERMEWETLLEDQNAARKEVEAKAKARAARLRSVSVNTRDLAADPSTFTSSPQMMGPPVIPGIPDDGFGLPIKPSTGEQSSPHETAFVPLSPFPVTTSLSLKRRVPTNDQLPNEPREKVSRTDTNGDEPSSSARTALHAHETYLPFSKETPLRPAGRQRFRSRSPPPTRGGNEHELQYDDTPDARPLYRSREVSPARREGHDTWRPDRSGPNDSIGYADDRYERREYPFYSYGRGGRGYAPRGGHRGRDGGRYRR